MRSIRLATAVLAFVLSLSAILSPVAVLAGTYGDDPFSAEYFQHQQSAREQREARERANEQQMETERQRSQSQLKQWQEGAAANQFKPKHSPDDTGTVNGGGGRTD